MILDGRCSGDFLFSVQMQFICNNKSRNYYHCDSASVFETMRDKRNMKRVWVSKVRLHETV